MAKKIAVNGSTSYPFEQTTTRVQLCKGMHIASIAHENDELYIGDGWDVVPNPNDQLAQLGDCPTREPRVVYSDIWAEMVQSLSECETDQDTIDVLSYYAEWHREYGDPEFAETLETVACDRNAAATFRERFIKRFAS